MICGHSLGILGVGLYSVSKVGVVVLLLPGGINTPFNGPRTTPSDNSLPQQETVSKESLPCPTLLPLELEMIVPC